VAVDFPLVGRVDEAIARAALYGEHASLRRSSSYPSSSYP